MNKMHYRALCELASFLTLGFESGALVVAVEEEESRSGEEECIGSYLDFCSFAAA